MASSSSHSLDFDFELLQTRTKVPFSWEAKPGVPKLQSRSSPSVSTFERSALKLPSPPYRSESARLPDDYGEAIPCSSPRAKSARMAKEHLWLEAYSDDFGSAFGFGCCNWDGLKERDPFVEAYKKCTNGPSKNRRPIGGGSATNGVKRPGIRRRLLFSLSRKCCVSSP